MTESDRRLATVLQACAWQERQAIVHYWWLDVSDILKPLSFLSTTTGFGLGYGESATSSSMLEACERARKLRLLCQRARKYEYALTETGAERLAALAPDLDRHPQLLDLIGARLPLADRHRWHIYGLAIDVWLSEERQAQARRADPGPRLRLQLADVATDQLEQIVTNLARLRAASID